MGFTEVATAGTLTRAGSIYKVENGYLGLSSMNIGGVEAAIDDSLTHPEGSVMSSGFFELKASEPLVYTYTCDEMKVVIKGEFKLTDRVTGEVTHAKERDVLFFPKGAQITFETPDYGLGFFVAHGSMSA